MPVDLQFYREKLEERRRTLVAADALAATDRAPVVLDQESVGRLSRIDAMQVQAMALAQARRRQAERAAIDGALRRLEDGEFGYCARCGDEITVARLEHNPSVTMCIDCARES